MLRELHPLAVATETLRQWVEVAVLEVNTTAAATLATTEAAQHALQSQPDTLEVPIRVRVSLRKGELLLGDMVRNLGELAVERR